MKNILSALFIFNALTIYALDMSQNPRLYQEVQANRESAYMPEFAQSSAGSSAGGNSIGGTAGSFVGNGTSTKNLTSLSFSGANGNFTFIDTNHTLNMLLDSEGNPISPGDFAITTTFNSDFDVNELQLNMNIGDSFYIMNIGSWGNNVDYSINRIDATGQTENVFTSNLIYYEEPPTSHNIGISVVGDKLTIEANGTEVVTQTSDELLNQKTSISIIGTPGATLSNFTLKE